MFLLGLNKYITLVKKPKYLQMTVILTAAQIFLVTDFSTVLCQIEAVISLGVGEWKLYKLFYYFSSREDANNLLEDIGKTL